MIFNSFSGILRVVTYGSLVSVWVSRIQAVESGRWVDWRDEHHRTPHRACRSRGRPPRPVGHLSAAGSAGHSGPPLPHTAALEGPAHSGRGAGRLAPLSRLSGGPLPQPRPTLGRPAPG